jgi:hypothetical protein
MRLLRVAITAISEAAKKPLAKINAKISIISNQKLSTVIGGGSYCSGDIKPGKNCGGRFNSGTLLCYEQVKPALERVGIGGL